MRKMLLFAGILISSSLKAQMIIDSLSGPLTPNEISAFKTYMLKIVAPAKGGQNVWVFGSPGKSIEACGLMYDASHDVGILDRMIYYCDAALSQRNDLASAANGGQLVTWTGKIDPVWPSSEAGVTPAGAGIEQGDVISHMAYCAQLILSTPSIWNTTVAIGDPKGYGTTYKARALKYIREGDYVIDNWILPRFIRTTESNHYYFPGTPNTYKPNEPAPWNQAWMLTKAFIRLVQCHVILGDATSRVTKYDAIAQSNINWFMANLTAFTSAIGSASWIWAYALPTGIEDTNHAAYDCEGISIAYFSGRYQLKYSDMIPFANMYFDVVMGTVTNGLFAGRVNGTTGAGHAGGDAYVRDEYIYLTDFRPEQFETVANVEIATGHIAKSIPVTARLLWEKNRRYTRTASAFPEAPSDLTANVISATQLNLTWKDNADNETGFLLQQSTDGSTWTSITRPAANVSSYAVTGLTAATLYYYRIRSVNGMVSSSFSAKTSATTAPVVLSNIALNKTAIVSNYYQDNSSYDAAKAVDGNLTTRWATDDNITTTTLEVDLGGTYTFGKTVITEYQSRTASYKIQYWNGSAWKDAFTGTTIGTSGKTDNFTNVTGTKLRLNILSVTGTKGPSIYEFAVYGFLSVATIATIAAPKMDVNEKLIVYPNPVAVNAKICYTVKENGKVNLTVYDISGQPVKVIINNGTAAGSYQTNLDASGLSAGTYIIRLTTTTDVTTLKILVIK